MDCGLGFGPLELAAKLAGGGERHRCREGVPGECVLVSAGQGSGGSGLSWGC